MKYNVIAVVQGIDEGMTTDIRYATNASAISAANAATMILADFEKEDRSKWDPTLISIKVEVI